MQISDLDLWIFRTPIAPADSARFESVFEFWAKGWEAVFVEIGRNEPVSSDQLSRQHEILVLFYREKPVAMVCQRFADLSLDSTFRDSYFKTAWSEKEIGELKAAGGTALIGSQIMVDREFRKSTSGLALKHLISFLSIEHAASLGVDVILGAMRVDKGMDKVFYEAGAETLASRRPYFGAEVDLVAFRPNARPVQIPFEFSNHVKTLLARAKRSEPFNFRTSTTRRAA